MDSMRTSGTNYLTFLLITNENPFSITCEKVGAREGSVNYFVENDFRAFKGLFDYDFSKIEEYLGVDCFSRLSDYKAIGKPGLCITKCQRESPGAEPGVGADER